MKLIWTKNTLPLSWLIRSVTGSDCSHCAIHFDHLGLVLHSNLLGVHLDTEANFFTPHLTVMHEIPKQGGFAEESEVLLSMVKKGAGNSYAFLGLIYAGICILLNRLFRLVIPKHNAWIGSRQELCTQIYDLAPDNFIPVIPGLEDLGMVYPHELYENLQALEAPHGNL